MATSARGGNFVSEWFGQRIYPEVRLQVDAISGEHTNHCPFLTEVLGSAADCVKNANSRGVCTVSSASNGTRQDWLVCPYRVISSGIVRQACKRIFGLDAEVSPLPVPVLRDEVTLQRFTDAVNETGAGYVFFQDKLGGEISS